MTAENLYIHFPFCRRKCTYCALHSRAGSTPLQRDGYVEELAGRLKEFEPPSAFATVYFGGGSPALCNLGPLLKALEPYLSTRTEFSVELHPLDVSEELLAKLADGGVNRISMGVQSLDDRVLADMGRGYTADEADRAFSLVKRRFDNAGIDLIAGYPGGDGIEDHDRCLERLRRWGLKHCSVYSLILEEMSILGKRYANGDRSRLPRLPSDDETLDLIKRISGFMHGIGLERYEISNYSVPGFECRHNLAVWQGEDYLGLGEGAHGRIGLLRTRNLRGLSPIPGGLSPSFGDRSPNTGGLSPIPGGLSPEIEEVSPDFDRKERTLFRLRTRLGLDASAFPEWGQSIENFINAGLLSKNRWLEKSTTHNPSFRQSVNPSFQQSVNPSFQQSVNPSTTYYLTERGTEVCDSILEGLA